MWRIEFSSDKFMPYLPESAQQNPGAYGFELAHWLSMQLATRGIATNTSDLPSCVDERRYRHRDVATGRGSNQVSESGDPRSRRRQRTYRNY